MPDNTSLKGRAAGSGAAVLFVLGMHRSGTSAFTRGIGVLGANFGNRLMCAREDNPKGFYEDGDFNRLHLEMFESIGMPWCRLTPLLPAEIDELERSGFAEAAAVLLREKMNSVGFCVLKHPRMAKVFPFWQRVLARENIDAMCLLALRHPLSVAASLSRRDGLGKLYSCLMWLAHIVPLLGAPPPRRTIVSEYDTLLNNPVQEMRRIGNFFGMEPDEGALEEYHRDFLDKNLRHSRFTTADLRKDEEIPDLVLKVYDHLSKCARDLSDLQNAETAALVQEWNREFFSLFPLLREIESLTSEHQRRSILLANAERELSWREKSLSWRMTKPLRSAASKWNRIVSG